jgi:hypothetical protein
VRHDDHHGGAEPRRVREGDADAVAAGEDADDPESDVRVLADAADARTGRGAGEGVLGLALLLLAQALAGVLDLDADAVGDLAAGDHHGLGGRRVAGRVVEEVGEDQREVVHQAAVHAEFGQPAQLDAVEVLDAADAAADDAEQPLRFLPLPAGPVRAAEHADAGGQAVGGADLLVEFHQPPGHDRKPAVFALHLVQPAAELAGEDVDAVADTDDGLFGGGGAVELLLQAAQRGAQDFAEFGLEVGADLGALLDARQQVVDGVTGAQPADRGGQLLVGETADRGHLVGQPFLPRPGLSGELRLVGAGLLGQSLLERLGVVRESCLVGRALFGEPAFVGGGLLGEGVLPRGAFGGEPALLTCQVLLPLLGVLGLRGAELGLCAQQLDPAAEQQPDAHGAGGRRGRAEDGRGDPVRTHRRGGDRPATEAERHQPPAAPGDRWPRRRWRSGEFHQHPSKTRSKGGVCKGPPS